MDVDQSRVDQAGGVRTKKTPDHGESTWTVIVAVAANAAIAIAKIVAGLFTGSASMWAEAAHSIADTGNEILLLVGLKRSLREPDRRHPFGYGQERYFWTFLAALGIFLVGGVLSIGEGVRSLLMPEPVESLWVGVGVLVVAAGFESYSWYTAHKQLRKEAREQDRSMRHHLRHASDPSATTVFLEDTAALIGLAIALVALVLHAVTGWAGWDAIGSMSIGLLLIVVAYLLARRSKGLLLDESAPADILDPIRERVESERWIATVQDLQAVWVGPSQLMVNMWVVPADSNHLVERVAGLRRELLEDDTVAQVTVTLMPG
ncbi:cation diffusion facilitator family transporter [Actinoplanes octamycinicus]|uniref:Cation diffusion facilitator family transporter n=1 Tax=Actinoplanes octamycinicus TaxID=135948 RepID=A0A7W7H006_9ACTN|nr:cation diffusion facilitator family transporter [Actinoplanes octamycinicus]MBB4741262.1 cation diffusion facilitator family transporter [Actinoplanes octamycinicus]